jgi:hypothetical protein
MNEFRSIYFLEKWRDAVRIAKGVSSGTEAMFFSQILLIGILCLYGYIGLRRAIRSAQ